MIISKTPFRFSLFGGGCDYPGWFSKNDSVVITSAMDYYCFIMVRKLGKFFIEYKSRASYSQIETVFDNKDFNHPSIRECLNFLGFSDERVSITHAGDLPARSGIGSSSSFTVGLIKAIKGINKENISANNLAKLACHIEQNCINEKVGVQDQYASSLGGILELSLRKGQVFPKKIKLSNEFISNFEKHILLGFTGVTRNSTDYTKTIIKHINENKIDEYLSQINEIAIEGSNLLKNENDIDSIAKLLKETWRLKIHLDDNSTYGSFNDIIKMAIFNGALAGKLMGAGGGGFFYLIANPKHHEKIKNKLKKIKIWVPFKFAKKGCTIINQNSLEK